MIQQLIQLCSHSRIIESGRPAFGDDRNRSDHLKPLTMGAKVFSQVTLEPVPDHGDTDLATDGETESRRYRFLQSKNEKMGRMVFTPQLIDLLKLVTFSQSM